MKNSESGRSRGFGFVTFADPANVDVVLRSGPHVLDSRTVSVPLEEAKKVHFRSCLARIKLNNKCPLCSQIDPKPCNPRSLQRKKNNVNYPKVFLGGLPTTCTETDLRNVFSRFGNVMEVVIMYDQEKKKSRGWYETRACRQTWCRTVLNAMRSSVCVGFGFLSFETEDAVDRCVSEHFVTVNGKQVSF